MENAKNNAVEYLTPLETLLSKIGFRELNV